MADTVGGGFPTSGVQKGATFFDIDDRTLWEYIDGDPRLVASWKLLNGTFTNDPDTSTWGTAQAGAIWFNTSENSFKGWDGSQIVQVTNGSLLSSLYNSQTSLIFQEDFISGSTTNGQIGKMGWQVSGGSSSLLNSETSHPGIIQRDTGAVINTLITLSHYFGIATAWVESQYQVRWIIRPNNDDTNVTWRIGSCSSFVSNPPAFGAYFEKIGAETTWFSVTRNNSIQERQNTNIPVIANTWYNLRIVRELMTIKFFINNVLVTTHTTNLSSFGQSVVQGINLAAVSKTIDIDYNETILLGLGR